MLKANFNISQTYFTAVQATHLIGDLQPGQSVLIHAGSSGVGQAAIQVARCGGASKVFVTAGSDAKCDLCKSLGADFAINYRTCGDKDFAEVIRHETRGKGVDLIIDLVGQSYWHRTTAAAAMEGRIVIVATMSGAIIEKFSLRDLMNKRLWVMTTTLRTRPPEYQKQLRDVVIEKALPYFAKGEMKVTVDEVFSWTEIGNAHKKMESNTHAGKLICNVQV